jgi:hypothetical protein
VKYIRAQAPHYSAVGDTPALAAALVSEFQARRHVLITATEAILALPAEGLDGQQLGEFMAFCGLIVPRLIVTERRARSRP